MKKMNIMLASTMGMIGLTFMGFWLPTNLKQEAAYHEENQRYLDAVSKGDINGVKSALAAGADINATTQNGQSALHLIANRNRPNYEDYEISGEDEIFFKINGKLESAAVVKAEEKKYYKLVNFLLEAGINTHIRDKEGFFAQDIASTTGDLLLENILIDTERARETAQERAQKPV
jgi:ankyrin repeat protein